MNIVSIRFGFPVKGKSSSDRPDVVGVSGIESTRSLKLSYIQLKTIKKHLLKPVLDKASTQLDENTSFQRSIGVASILNPIEAQSPMNRSILKDRRNKIEYVTAMEKLG